MDAINSMNSYLDSIKSPIKYIFMLFILPETISKSGSIFKTIAKFYVFDNIYDFSLNVLHRHLQDNQYQ